MPGAIDPGGYHRYVALRFVVVAALATVGLWGARASDGVLPRGVVVAAAAVVLAGLASALVGTDPVLSAIGEPTRMFGLAAGVLVVAGLVIGAGSGLASRHFAIGAVVGAIVVGATGVAQLTGVAHHEGRLTSTFGNAGFLGAYAALVLPLLIAVVRRSADWLQPAAAVAAGLLFVSLLGSGSRGAWVGAFAGLLTACFVWFPSRARIVVAFGVGGLCLVAIAGLATRHGNRDAPDTARGRVDTWVVSTRAFADRPLLGWGAEGFRLAFGRNVDRGWIDRYGTAQVQDRAHNRFIDDAVAGGVVGLAADVGLIVAIAVAARRMWRGRDADRDLAVSVGAGLVGLLIAEQFLFDTFDVAFLAAIFAGALVATDRDRSSRGLPAARVAAVLLVPALGVVWTGALNLLADRKLHSASGDDAATAFAKVSDAISLRPHDPEAYVLLGAIARHSGNATLLRAADQQLAEWDDDDVVLARLDVLRSLAATTADQSYQDEVDEIVARLRQLRPTDPRLQAARAMLSP